MKKILSFLGIVLLTVVVTLLEELMTDAMIEEKLEERGLGATK